MMVHENFKDVKKETKNAFYRCFIESLRIQMDNSKEIRLNNGLILDKHYLNGLSKIFWENKGCFNGEIKDNEMTGDGSLTLPKQSTHYVGSFLEGLYHGKGLLRTKNWTYNGEFLLGIPNGKGKLVSKDNLESLEGIFKDGKLLKGVRIYRNGTFEGDFDENQEKTFGKYTFKDDSFYFGSWQGNNYSGFGIFTWKAKKSKLITEILKEYKGSWKEGRFHGFGILRFKGMILFSIWKNGIKNGPGVLLAPNDEIIVSWKMFEDDRFLEARKLVLSEMNKTKLQDLCKIDNTNDFMNILKSILETSETVPLDKDIFPLFIPDQRIDPSPIVGFIQPFISSEDNFKNELRSIYQVLDAEYFSLQAVYRNYANFGRQKHLEDTCLNRLGLLMFFEDLGWEKFGLDLWEFMQNAEIKMNIVCLEEDSCQERITFARFLKYLVFLTMTIFKERNMVDIAKKAKPPFFGLFATMFAMVLNEFVLPLVNSPVGHQESPSDLQRICHLVDSLEQPLALRSAYRFFQGLKNQDCSLLHSKIPLETSNFGPLIDFESFSVVNLPELFLSVFPSLKNESFIVESEKQISPIQFYEILCLFAGKKLALSTNSK